MVPIWQNDGEKIMGLNDYLVSAKCHPVYLCVTNDEFELPIAVADSASELARMLHVDITGVIHATSRTSKRKPKQSKYKLVWIDESEDEG